MKLTILVVTSIVLSLSLSGCGSKEQINLKNQEPGLVSLPSVKKEAEGSQKKLGLELLSELETHVQAKYGLKVKATAEEITSIEEIETVTDVKSKKKYFVTYQKVYYGNKVTTGTVLTPTLYEIGQLYKGSPMVTGIHGTEAIANLFPNTDVLVKADDIVYFHPAYTLREYLGYTYANTLTKVKELK